MAAIVRSVATLSADAGRPLEACREALRQLLLTSSVPEKDRTSDSQGSESSFFAFKLHQFISGAGHALSTLERPGSRTVIVDGQQFLPEHPDKHLSPVHFCRECGHEYHPVRLVQEEGQRYFLGRDIEDAPQHFNDFLFVSSIRLWRFAFCSLIMRRVGLNIGGYEDRPDWPEMGPSILRARVAVRAREGDMGIIPGSMGARSYKSISQTESPGECPTSSNPTLS